MKFIQPTFQCAASLSKRNSFTSSFLTHFLAVIFMSGLTGCAHVELSSSLGDMPQSQPQRLLVVLTATPTWSAGIKSFSSSFTDELQACGSQSDIFLVEAKLEDLSLKDEAAEKRQKLINEEANFSPDGILFVSSIAFTSASGYGVTNLQFDLAYYNRAPTDKLRRPSWHGKATVPAGLSSDFAAMIIKNMKKDGILQKCPAINE